MLRDLILNYLQKQPDIDSAKLQQPGIKMEELGLDSLGMVEMLFEVEDTYGFQIENPVRYNRMTLDEVIADLDAAIRAKHGGVVPDVSAQNDDTLAV